MIQVKKKKKKFCSTPEKCTTPEVIKTNYLCMLNIFSKMKYEDKYCINVSQTYPPD